ncbi:MAG: succinate dehydrogenase cytochrome b subunit [Elusimicrobiota bacterium]|jgi:succinate dehydrogenase / fumarate reductase, cytochrome b subunit
MKASSSIGKKILMAASGLVLLGFVVGHLLGNLQIFLGQEKVNAYAVFLKGMPAPLWSARVFLLLMLAAHVWTAVVLTRENRAARPVAYARKDFVKASYASRTMMMSGLIVFAFIVYHLLHFTFGAVHAETFSLQDPKGRHDVYSMMVMGFRNPFISGAYLAGVFLLGLHLSHGLSSAFQTLGLSNEKVLPVLRRLGSAAGWLIFLGYAAIPAAVLLGFVQLPEGVLKP